MITNDNDNDNAHLRTALHHAPDRDAGPPAAISARVRKAARDATRERRRTTLPGFFDWLTRPATAGAFGTVALATVIGWMWRDGPPPSASSPAADVSDRAAAAPDARPEATPAPPARVPAVVQKAAPNARVP